MRFQILLQGTQPGLNSGLFSDSSSASTFDDTSEMPVADCAYLYAILHKLHTSIAKNLTVLKFHNFMFYKQLLRRLISLLIFYDNFLNLRIINILHIMQPQSFCGPGFVGYYGTPNP
ncbi:hypothetical protein EJB05_16783, partial [Eragrostis curvula]